jgi:hypothetical protein
MPNELNDLASELHAYIDALAQSSTLIGYDGNNSLFLSMGIEEIATKPQLDFAQGYGLILEQIDGQLSGKHLNDCAVGSAVSLWFLKHVKADDLQTRKTVCNEAFRIGMHFIGKMKFDQEQVYEPGDPSGVLFKTFDLNNVSYDVAGPVGDQFWGYRFEFNLMKEGKLDYDEGNWV